MKRLHAITPALILWIAAVVPALAASTEAPTHTVYSSGILVLGFVGFCALVLVVQLIPAIMTLWGMIVGICTNKGKEEIRVPK